MGKGKAMGLNKNKKQGVGKMYRLKTLYKRKDDLYIIGFELLEDNEVVFEREYGSTNPELLICFRELLNNLPSLYDKIVVLKKLDDDRDMYMWLSEKIERIWGQPKSSHREKKRDISELL